MMARGAPYLLACGFIDSGDKRSFAGILIALQNHQIAVEYRRGAVPHTAFGYLTKRSLPDWFAVESIAVKSFGFERQVNIFAVGDGRRRSIGIFAVAIGIDCAF